MKAPNHRNILWLLPLLFIDLFATAQTTSKPKDKFAIDIDAGVAYPINSEFNEIFKAGMNVSLGFKRAFLKSRRLWLKPMGTFKFYSKKSDVGGESMTETFRN